MPVRIYPCGNQACGSVSFTAKARLTKSTQAHSTRELRIRPKRELRAVPPPPPTIKHLPPATPPTPAPNGRWQDEAVRRAFTPPPLPDIDVPGAGWALEACDPNGTYDPFVAAADEYAAQYAA